MCAALDGVDLPELEAIATPVAIAPGQRFVAEGDPAAHFFNVTAGTAKLFKLLPDGRRMVTGFAERGQFLGLAVTSGYAFSAEAVDAVMVCRYTRPRLKALLLRFPAMERRLLDAAAGELVAAQEQMLLLGRKSADERMASFLLGRPVMRREKGENGEAVALPMSRADIADYLGLSLETVSRSLTRLRKARLIDVPTPWRILVRDRNCLEHLAGGR
jgi:CRP/FNR family transcriptional regulator, anaerobic regulatory protein